MEAFVCASHALGTFELLVDDVDKEFERLKSLVSEWVQEPTTMPWGNRSILFPDLDGNLVNLFTSVTEGRRSRGSGSQQADSVNGPQG
jgi:hypothetical protein